MTSFPENQGLESILHETQQGWVNYGDLGAALSSEGVMLPADDIRRSVGGIEAAPVYAWLQNMFLGLPVTELTAASARSFAESSGWASEDQALSALIAGFAVAISFCVTAYKDGEIYKQRAIREWIAKTLPILKARSELLSQAQARRSSKSHN